MVYRARGLRVLGISQFFIGFLMIVLAIASLASLEHWTSYIATGIWVGLWVGLTGLFAFLGAKSDNRPNNCLIGVMIGFAVTGCVLSGVMIIIYSIGLAEFAQRIRCPQYIDYRPTPSYDSYYNSYESCHNRYSYSNYYGRVMSYSAAQTGAAIGSLLLILALVEFFVALASSIYGCNASCCTMPAVQTTQQISYLQQPGGNVIVLNPHGSAPPGTAFQTINTYPGQVLPVLQTVQPQTYVTSPQGMIQQGQPGQTMYPVQPGQPGQTMYPVQPGQTMYPVQPGQPYQAQPVNAQVNTGGAFGVQQPSQAFQEPQSKQSEMPPPYM